MNPRYLRVCFIISVIAAPILFAEPIIDPIPASRLAGGEKVKFKKIKWSADCPWMGKKAPVCKVKKTLKDPAFLHEFAKKRNLKRLKKWRYLLGEKDDEIIVYEGKKRYTTNALNRNTHYTVISLKQKTYKQDAKYQPVIKNVPDDEEALKIAKKWLPVIGVDEKDLYHLLDDPQKLLVRIGHHHVGGNDPITLKPYSKKYGVELTFSQQIGGLAADWNGFGGRVKIDLIDEGEFAIARHCLRSWEIMGHYPVLSKKEVEEALRGDFHWAYDVQPCETLEITQIRLEAYHSPHDVPQRHFPLMYYIKAKPLNAPAGTPAITINIPALKMHRHLYGALPPPQKKKAAAPCQRKRRRTPSWESGSSASVSKNAA